MKVMVTGAGGPAGYGVINSLDNLRDSKGKHKHYLIKVDIDPLSAGLYVGKNGTSHIVPRADNKYFMESMLTLARSENTDIVLPTVEEELIHFSRDKGRFEAEGIAVAVSNVQSLLRSNNKANTYAFFKGAEYCPEIYNGNSVRFPAFIKPIDSRGARGAYRVDNQNELLVLLAKNERSFGRSIIMEYLPGTEYSVYGLSDLDGRPLVTVPVKRIQASGTSTKAQISKNPKVTKIANEIATKIGLQGPWNIQLMDSGTSVKLVEINPRFAGTLALPVHAGVHLSELTIKLFMGMKIEESDLRYRTGIFMTRHSKEIFLEEKDLVK